MIDRFRDITGTMSPVQVHDREIADIISEMGRGFDPTFLPEGSVPANKLKILKAATGVTGIRVGPGAVAAGGRASSVLSVNAPGGNYGLGQSFLLSQYLDWFVDPSDLTNLYNNNCYPEAGNTLFDRDCYLRNSVGNTATQLCQFVITVVNRDSVSHSYYYTLTAAIAAHQVITPQ